MAESESNMNLRRFDLNLLPILRALLSTHSVARASEILGLSQSATSGALARLRIMFGDPLLILVGRQLVPTPYANALEPLLGTTFAELHALLDQRVFDPAREERCFVISSPDYVIADVGLPLLQLLSREAPGVTVRFVEISNHHRSAMINGEIDFMLSPRHAFVSASDDFKSTPFYIDEMVIISSSDFRGTADVLDVAAYLAADHIAYGVADGETFEQWSLAKQGLKPRTILTIPQFNQLPRYVSASQCLAMIPRHIACAHAEAFDLRIWPVPFPIDQLEIAIHWSHVLDRNPAHIWFRDLMNRALLIARAEMPPLASTAE